MWETVVGEVMISRKPVSVAVVMLCSLVWFPRIAKRVAGGGGAVTVYRLDWLQL